MIDEGDVVVSTKDVDAPAVDLTAILANLTEAIQRMGNHAPSDVQAELLQIVAENQRRQMPENKVAPPVSAFNPTGDKHKPLLRRKTYFVGAEMQDDLLTVEEVELFNRVDRSTTARSGKWTAVVKQNGSTEELHVMVPHKEIDQRMELPSLKLILRELLDGKEAADPDSLVRRVLELEQKLAAATAA